MDRLELSIIDVETTGISAARDRIIEVAVLRVSKGTVVERFSTLVDPERPIPPFIKRLTGITSGDLRGAPVFGEIKEELLRLLDGTILVAHNARFDYAFVRQEFEREHIAFSATCLCTARLSRRLFPECHRHNLDSIIGRFSLGCAHRHRAPDDALVLWDFLKILEGRTGQERLRGALDVMLRLTNPKLSL